MRRSLARSVFGFVLAAAFVLARVEEGAGARHCPHHDAVPGGAVAADGTHAAPADSGAPHPGHRDAGTDDARGAQPSHGEEGHGPLCTCMGECQSASAVSLPTPSIAVVLLRLPQTPARPLPDAPLPARAVAQPHTIPYATAPPLIA